MSRSFAEIAAVYSERKRKRSPEFQKGYEIREQYNGDVVIPLPEMEKTERNAVANLLTLGLDQTAMRISSTAPEPLFAPSRPGIAKSEKQAEDRHKAVLGWWDMNSMELLDARGARHFIGYGQSPRVLLPDFKRKIPTWQLRDPLNTYPAASSNPDDMTPDDCIFAYYQPLWFLKEKYPEAMGKLARYRTANGDFENRDELFEVIEYIDHEDIVLGVIGTKSKAFDNTIVGSEAIELIRTPNKAGVCTAVIPGRVSLDVRQGQFDGMLGMYQQQAMLQALSVIATKKGIFKDEWIIARAGEIPKILKMANGLNGEIGIIQGGDIKGEAMDPSYMAPQMIDRLEAMQRQQGGIPAQMTGNNPTNVRTGRASDSLLGATIDFTVAEAQKVLARARHEENVRAMAIDKGYWRKPKSFHVPWNGSITRLDYNPQELWESDEHRVTFPHAGVDENGRTIEIGQLLGMGLITKEKARRDHPLIDDPVREGNGVVKEGLEQALLAGLQNQASQPGANVADIARIVQLTVENNKDLAQAILDVQREAQERQAKLDAQGNPAMVDPNSPEAQPGMAAPGQGAEAGTMASIDGPSENLQNLGNLFSRVRQPNMSIAAERTV